MTLEEHWKAYVAEAPLLDRSTVKQVFFAGVLAVHVELKDAVASKDMIKVTDTLIEQGKECINFWQQDLGTVVEEQKESWLWQRVAALFSSR